MYARTFQAYLNPIDYRFGFNGQEKVDEISGAGNHNTALFWEYDTRLGRRWNIDPVVKPWQSPYSGLDNNPIWKADPLGDKAEFKDDQAKKDFDAAHEKVKNRISDLNTQINGYNDKLKGGTLTNREAKKVEKQKNQAEETLSNWNKLNNDFENIINDPNVSFIYSSETKNLQSNENGKTGGPGSYFERDDKGNITAGKVYIDIRPGHDEAVIHENRHGNQNLNGTFKSSTVLQRETEAYIYQQIYNYESVQKTILNARNDKYQFMDEWARPSFNMDDMINWLYKDLINK